MSFALAERLSAKVWEVYCTRCKQSIGTMAGDTLFRAIMATAHKGGVMCPQCRGNSCATCGVEVVTYTLEEQELLGEFRKCWYCEAEEGETINDVLKMDVPLV